MSHTISPAAAFAPLSPYAGYPCLVYTASRPLTDAESADLSASLSGFLGTWASHGSPVNGAGVVIDNRFLIVAHRPHDIAGCSRDSLLFFLQEAGTRLGLEWVGGSRVFYRESGSDRVVETDRPGFRERAAAGVVTPETVVYDTTVRETSALLDGRFTPAARDSWHARLMG